MIIHFQAVEIAHQEKYLVYKSHSLLQKTKPISPLIFNPPSTAIGEFVVPRVCSDNQFATHLQFCSELNQSAVHSLQMEMNIKMINPPFETDPLKMIDEDDGVEN
jgi:hypothetical protein